MKKKDLHHLVQPLRCPSFSLFVLLAGFVLTTLHSAPVAGLYVDGALAEPGLLRHAAVNDGSESYHLFSHGRPGQLLIDGQWLDAPALGAWLNDGRLDGKEHLLIYGCHFGQGETGRAAVAYLSEALGLPVAASDDLTGPDGDWQLEVTTPGLPTTHYLLPTTHYLLPTTHYPLTNYPHNLQAPCGVDIHIANDNSGSVNAEENRQSRAFVSQLGLSFSPLSTANTGSRISVSTWANTGTFEEYSFPGAGPNYTTSLTDVISYASSPRTISGGTNVYDALLRASQVVAQNPIGGRTTPKVIVLMTDASCGQIAPNIVPLATQLKSQGVYIVVMAIDNASTCPVLQGANVASPGGYFAAGDYDVLFNDAISFIQGIQTTACANAGPPEFDLTVNLSNFEITNCNPGPASASASYTVTNNSFGEAFNGNLQISFYNGDPTLPGTQYLFTENAGTQTVALNGGTFSGTVNDPSLLNTATIYAVVNFDGGQPGNGVPLFYSQLPNQITVPDEADVSNNISSATTRTDGTGCLPFASLQTQVTTSGVGCNDQLIYNVEVCNTGAGDAVMSGSNIVHYPPAGAILLSSDLIGSNPFSTGTAVITETLTPIITGSQIESPLFNGQCPDYIGVDVIYDGVFYSDRNRRAFHQFDFSGLPAGAVITSANLRFVKADNSTYGNFVLSIRRNITSWSESPNCSTSGPYSPNFNFSEIYGTEPLNGNGPEGTVYNISINPQLINGWINNTYPNYGLSLYGPSEHPTFVGFDIYSDEAVDPADRPQLTIQYEGAVSELPANTCVTYEYMYDISGLAAGSYDYSVAVSASPDPGNDPVQYGPNTNFTAYGDTGLNGFNGASNSSDNVTYSGSSPACPVGDQVTMTLAMTGNGNCPGDFSTATITIDNQSGQTLSNALLTLDLSGTGATYSGEPYNKTNGIVLAEPNIFDPAYPNVANALSEKTGPQTLAIFTLPVGVSTFALDLLIGTDPMALASTITQLPTIINASGDATASDNITPGTLPTISGSCPADVTAAATTLTLNYTATNATSVQWSSGSSGSFANPNAATTTYNINDIDRANGFVDLALTALSADACDETTFCRVLISGIVYDYGDAPASYDLGENSILVAAAATVSPDIFLGTTPPDAEATTQPTVDATGDGADEDGLMSTTLPVALLGQSNYAVDIQVTNNSGSDAYVYGFMDWNDDGDWNADPDERSALLTVPTGGLSTQTLLFNVPAGYTGGMRFLRLRLSSDDVAVGSFFGPAANGEVEDYEATALVCLDPPTADAGAGTDNICSNEDYAAMATATNGTIAWTTSGDGTFADPAVEDAVYTPGSGDISSGSVTLTLTVTGTSPVCAGEIATDDVTLTIGVAPTADAGAAAGAVCADDAYTAAATATGGTIAWTTSGDGSFANATVEDAVYTPGTADITAGTVTLTMTVTGTNPGCGATTASDMVLLTINPLPATPAITGDTAPLCLNETRILTTTASGTIVWSSSDVSVATVDPNTGEVTPVAVGSVDITYMVTDANGCSATSGAFPLTITDVGCAGQLEIKVMLQGALLGSPDALMRDDLRSGGYIPLSEPYSGSGNPRFTAHGSGGGETTTSGVLAANTGTPDAIVDWVLVELRDAAAPATILETRAALLQRDGDVVNPTDGVSPLVIDGTTGSSYYVSVKHRNHLGVMTAAPRAFIVGATTTVDFITATAAEVFDVSGGVGYDGFERILISGQQALWAGNANADDQVKYQGPGNDAGNILFEVLFFPTNTGFVYNFNNAFGYFPGDINMDGQVKYQGPANDPSFVFFNLIFNYSGLNTSNLYNYDFLTEQLP